MNPGIIEALERIVGADQTFTDAKALAVFSRDHHWFSPLLVEALEGRHAAVVVAPDTKTELQQIVALAVRENVPLVMRGAGTGNYGQSVPLHGGILVNLHRLNRILEIDVAARTARVEAGCRLGALERHARELGLELRIYPSTWATCTMGGFVGGGFGGVGSIQYGTLWDGNVLEVEVLPVTAAPEFERLSGSDLMAVIHAYGTTAIMTELTVPLAEAVPWEESVFSFPSLQSALSFAHELALDAGHRKREIAVNEWPIPGYFKPLVAAGGVRPDRTNVLLELESGRSAAIAARAEAFGGSLDWLNPHETYRAAGFALTDFTWNHTTLWAIKSEPEMTYLQVGFDPPRLLEQIGILKERFGDEILMHIEFIRERFHEGAPVATGSLPLVRFTNRARLYEIIETCESIGARVANPHVYYLDDDPRWSGAPVLEAVGRFNPAGLLNPGKIKALEAEPVGAAPLVSAD